MAGLIATLPEEIIPDIIGDIHGEIDALQNLLRHLGYGADGVHRDNPARRPLFVGDLCDRGPDSVAVSRLVQKYVQSGQALAILGNHELNLLNGSAKDGSGWYFSEQYARDAMAVQYRRADETEKAEIAAFYNTLPLAYERADVRIVHAVWDDAQINQVRAAPPQSPRETYRFFRDAMYRALENQPWQAQYRAEQDEFERHKNDAAYPMPLLAGVQQFDLFCGNFNPLHGLTCGVEYPVAKPFFSAGRWRFTSRARWWENYRGDVPVVIGHYWRQWRGTYSPHTVISESGSSWMGAAEKVFCIDYSVGARWRERLYPERSHPPFRLAALRWDSKTLFFDNGEKVQIAGSGK